MVGNVMRPTIDQTLMEIAWTMGKRGTCTRRQVGCVIADHRGVILSSGWNGALAGMDHCSPHDNYQSCDRSEHAERNAIYWAARRGVSIEGAIIHTTDSPCGGCARGIIQSGIQRVVYARPYRDDYGIMLLLANGVEVTKLAIDQVSGREEP